MSRPTPPPADSNPSQPDPLSAESLAAIGLPLPGRSTGPRTTAGKARSRANAVKHGLRCQVVEPPRDREAIAERVASWSDALQPANVVESWLVARAAAQSVRLDRCRERECLALEENTAKAERDWVRRQRAWARRLGHQLDTDPERIHARLTRSALGCDWLSARLDDLARDLEIPGGYWSTEEFVRALGLLGLEARRRGPDHPVVAPLWRLTLTAQSRPDPASVDTLLNTDTTSLDEPARVAEQRRRLGDREPARRALLALVRAEQDRLAALRFDLWSDHDAPALDAFCARARASTPAPKPRTPAATKRPTPSTCTAPSTPSTASAANPTAPTPNPHPRPSPRRTPGRRTNFKMGKIATQLPSLSITSEHLPEPSPASPSRPPAIAGASAERPRDVAGSSSPRLDGEAPIDATAARLF